MKFLYLNHCKYPAGFAIYLVWFLICTHSISGSDDFSWFDRSNGLWDLSIQVVAVSPHDTRLLLCASDSFIYQSTDGGVTWNSVFRIPGRKRVLPVRENKRGDDPGFSRKDYDEDDLFREGVLEEGESLDDLDDDDLMDRLKDHGLYTPSEPKDRDSELSTVKSGWMNKTFDLIWDVDHPDYAYIATSRGLYRTDNSGQSWRLAANQLSSKARTIRSLAFTDPDHKLILATDSGLYVSENRGDTVYPVQGMPGNSAYTAVSAFPDAMSSFVATDGTFIYQGNASGHVNRVSAPLVNRSDVVVGVMEGPSFGLCLVSTKNVFYSRDLTQWEYLGTQVLGGAEIRDFTRIGTTLYLATNRGVFRWYFESDTGGFINTGLMELDVRMVRSTDGDSGQLWAATGTGIFLFSNRYKESGRVVSELPVNFPPFSEVLATATDYAQLKIAEDELRIRKIRRAPWYPEISLDMSMDTDADTDYYRSRTISLSSQNIYIGPDDMTWKEDKDEDYSVQLMLKWSPTISPLLNLMARKQLRREVKRRHELIITVRTLYFNYIIGLQEFKHMAEGRRKITKSLELHQIEAQIDALTGFYFSGRIHETGSTYE